MDGVLSAIRLDGRSAVSNSFFMDGVTRRNRRLWMRGPEATSSLSRRSYFSLMDGLPSAILLDGQSAVSNYCSETLNPGLWTRSETLNPEPWTLKSR